MFTLGPSWVWDFWTADDGENYHLFFLYAPKSLPHPDDRHYSASIGHAVSSDLRHWTRVEDALLHGEPGDFDALATWTGSVTRREDGVWHMLYTGAVLAADNRNVQTIGVATSTDLFTWTKHGAVAEASPQWYEKLADESWHDEAFRDPWVVRDPGGAGWHMLITARGKEGPADDRGVVGHAWSPDLRQWEVRPPLSKVGQGFGQLEVMHTVEVDGQWFLLFSCLGADLSASRQGTTQGGTWAARAEGPLGPYDIAGARVISPPGLYVGRLIRLRNTDSWQFLAFVNADADGEFGGTIIDPLPVEFTDGEIRVG